MLSGQLLDADTPESMVDLPTHLQAQMDWKGIGFRVFTESTHAAEAVLHGM